MNDIEYETVIILKPDLSMAKLDKTKEQIKNKINSFGSIIEEDTLGVKKLAYEIKKYKEGYYQVYAFKLNTNNSKEIKELERFYRIDDNIMRFIVVKRG